jgi:hypothetical protein
MFEIKNKVYYRKNSQSISEYQKLLNLVLCKFYKIKISH